MPWRLTGRQDFQDIKITNNIKNRYSCMEPMDQTIKS